MDAACETEPEYTPEVALGATNTAPRFRMTRLSPSRTSTVFRSFADINLTIRSSSETSIGLLDVLLLDESARLRDPRFLVFLFNVATLEGLIERRQHFAA